MSDLIDRQMVSYKLTDLVNEFEEILSHIREREENDSVCGLCEYDGAYMGQSGDWCNECPGFDKADCFKLKDKYKKEWLELMNTLPSVQPEFSNNSKELEKNSKELENKNGELISRQEAIDALKICDNNEDGINCHKCPLRDERWDGAWQDNETNCYRKLMRDSAKLLELQSVQPEVIRCKDCKHWMMGKTTKNYPNPYICELHSFMHGFERSALPEDYCSWAELR